MRKDNVKAREKQTEPQGGQWTAMEGLPCCPEVRQNKSRIQENLLKWLKHTGIPENIVIDKPVTNNC